MIKTIKPADIIGDCIRWDKAKKDAENIPADYIAQRVQEVFPADLLEKMKSDTMQEINKIFNK